jgi:hypothetical protein
MSSTEFAGFRVPEGYVPGDVALCRGARCRRPVLWARTIAGRAIPLDRSGDAHFSTCPDAAEFRGRRSTARA